MDRQRLTNATTSITNALGSFASVGAAISLIVTWGASGFLFHYSSAWQLFINTTTTIVTFVMVFIIQNTTNRESKALHVKMDAIISALETTDDSLIGLEERTDREIEEAKANVRP